MSIQSILVVCLGNICRSPVGERLLREGLPQMQVASAGLGAVVGKGADARTAQAAAAIGLSLEGHVARQFSAAIGRDSDLILVMEPKHRRMIAESHPELSGRVMLFDHWLGGQGIPDPYGAPLPAHVEMVRRLAEAAESWIGKLGKAAT